MQSTDTHAILGADFAAAAPFVILIGFQLVMAVLILGVYPSVGMRASIACCYISGPRDYDPPAAKDDFDRVEAGILVACEVEGKIFPTVSDEGSAAARKGCAGTDQLVCCSAPRRST